LGTGQVLKVKIMKIDGYEVPYNLLYSKKRDKPVKIGITDYAQKMLREITFIYLPEKDVNVKGSAVFGSIESIKAISELYSPLTGKIVEVNEMLRKRPRIINEDPYGEGWIIKIYPLRLEEELKHLIKPRQYAAYVKELIKIDKNLLIYKWRKGTPR
jgi:glycine cleavage system H protein